MNPFILRSFIIAIATYSLQHSVSAEVDGPLTTHFQDWLNVTGYAADDFVRFDYGTQGSYGGKSSDDEKVERAPVVFFHGNSDSALSAGVFNGWTNSIQYFLDNGYKTAELYATSWGDDNSFKSGLRTHDCETVQRLRRFLLAVKDYTNSEKVHIVAHSMGVTLARKIVIGGKITANDGNCDVGIPLRFVDVFVGLAGANYGLCNCANTLPISNFEPTCNHDDGFWPGDSCGDNKICGAPTMASPCDYPLYSKFLTDLNNDFSQLAKRVVSAWSKVDDGIMYGDNVWGKPTSLIPRSTDQKIYGNYSHMQTKESPESVADQYKWINRLDTVV